MPESLAVTNTIRCRSCCQDSSANWRHRSTLITRIRPNIKLTKLRTLLFFF